MSRRPRAPTGGATTTDANAALEGSGIVDALGLLGYVLVAEPPEVKLSTLEFCAGGIQLEFLLSEPVSEQGRRQLDAQPSPERCIG